MSGRQDLRRRTSWARWLMGKLERCLPSQNQPRGASRDERAGIRLVPGGVVRLEALRGCVKQTDCCHRGTLLDCEIGQKFRLAILATAH